MYFSAICEEMIYKVEVIDRLSSDYGMELAALILSILSILISVVTLWQDRRTNITNLQATYFEKIFSEYCTEKIPQKASQLKFVKGRLSHTYNDLIYTMMEMIEDCGYFQYAKNTFYKELQEETIKLEDKLLNEVPKLVENREEQIKFIDSVNEDIRQIIKLINKNYHKF